MDWFERLTGFAEPMGPGAAEATRQRLAVEGGALHSRVNARCYAIGQLELVSLGALRQRAAAAPAVGAPSSLRLLAGGVRELHGRPEHAGSLFQVASQFNLLEMTGPEITPEHGVTRYAGDPTQGPACAIAAGAATLYRQYFVPVGGGIGQSHDRQLDGFDDLGAAVAAALGAPPASLWTMRNGYTMFSAAGIRSMSAHVQSLDEHGREALRQRLQIGLHWDVEVTDAGAAPGTRVSQALCSALPVAYHAAASTAEWAPLASLVLEAAYEATLWAAVIQAQRGASPQVLLTWLGGGAFGNDAAWIRAALARAVDAVRGHGLAIALVSRSPPPAAIREWAQALA